MLARRIVAIGMVFAMIWPAIAIGGASGPSLPNNAPSFVSAYVIPNIAIVLVGYVGWSGQWQNAPFGQQLYTNTVDLIVFDTQNYPQSISIVVNESSLGYYSNSTITIQPNSESVVSESFQNNQQWTHVSISFDGVRWEASVATPISLLPNSIANVGGLDLLVLAIVSEALVAFAAMVALARWFMVRARWAPKFSLLVWGHVVLVGIVAAVVFDYQFIDSTFAGFSPLVYVLSVAPMFWLFALSLFNNTQKTEILQTLARNQGKILYRRWLLTIGKTTNGDVILIHESWGGFFARFFGHAPTLTKNDPTIPEPFMGSVINMKSPTKTKGKHRRYRRFPWENYEIANPQPDNVQTIQWTSTGSPMIIDWPHLTIHKKVTMPAIRNNEGIVTTPERTVNKLSLPHYTEAKVTIELESDSYAPIEAVRARWATIADLGRVISKIKTDLQILKAGVYRYIEAEVESRLAAYYSAIGRIDTDIQIDEISTGDKKHE